MDTKTIDTMFSKNSDEYSTPIDFYNRLNNIYRFTLDPASTKENAKCQRYYTIKEDGLNKTWGYENVFLNPPYSQNYKWIQKAYEEAKFNNATVAVLIPSRTDTKYFHDFCLDKEVVSDMFFVKGRLKFNESKNTAPFPSVVVVFKNTLDKNRMINVSTIRR